MAANEVHIDAAPERVFAVLGDANRYPEWLVGARDVTDSDPDFPAAGTKFDFEIGAGPLTLSDHTKVLESDPPSRLVLEAVVRPAGSFRIEFRLRVDGSGTLLTMYEEPASGLVDRLDNPLQDRALGARNEASLAQLKELVESG